VRLIILLLMLTSCVSKRSPQPSDTKLNPDKRNWVEVYSYEMQIAKDNDDEEAYYFFLQEIIKYQYKIKYNTELPANPSIRIIK